MTQPKTSAKGSPRATGGGKKKVAVGGAGAVVLAIVVLAVQHFTGVDLTGQGAKAGDGDQPVPIGIGFQNRHQAYPGADMAADSGIILA